MSAAYVLGLHTIISNSFVALSGRMPQLVSIILEAGAASNLIEDYAACLETRAEESQAPEIPDDDIGSLILRVSAPNLIPPQIPQQNDILETGLCSSDDLASGVHLKKKLCH